MVGKKGAMWRCPSCGRLFASKGQVHTCRRLGSIEPHFERATDEVRATFERFVAVVERLGPVEILAQKTRIAFHARMSFAVIVPRQRWLNGHLVLAERVEDPHFLRITTYSASNHVVEFRLTCPQDIDPTMEHWIAQAYEVGLQRHHNQHADDS